MPLARQITLQEAILEAESKCVCIKQNLPFSGCEDCEYLSDEKK